jgi:iron complex transport system substrate-binding protein
MARSCRALGISLALVLACLGASCERAQKARSVGCTQRVVSLHDVTTEALVELGAAACLVGIAELEDVPDSVRRAVTDVRRVASAETVLATAPTHVYALEVVTEHEAGLVDALARRKVPYHAPRLERLDDVRALVARIAGDLSRQEAAKPWLSELTRTESTALAGPRVLVFDCCAPPFTAGKHALVTDLLRLSGASNVFAEVDDTWFHTSWEAAVGQKPDLVLIDDYGSEGSLTKKREALQAVTPLSGVPVLVLPLRDMLGTIRTGRVLDDLKKRLAGSRG